MCCRYGKQSERKLGEESSSLDEFLISKKSKFTLAPIANQISQNEFSHLFYLTPVISEIYLHRNISYGYPNYKYGK